MSRTTGPATKKTKGTNWKLIKQRPRLATLTRTRLLQTSSPPDHHSTPSRRSKSSNMLSYGTFPLKAAWKPPVTTGPKPMTLSRLGQLRNYLQNVRRLVSDRTWLQRLREEHVTLVKSLSWISECGDNSEVRLNIAQWWSKVVFRGESETLAEDQRGVES